MFQGRPGYCPFQVFPNTFWGKNAWSQAGRFFRVPVILPKSCVRAGRTSIVIQSPGAALFCRLSYSRREELPRERRGTVLNSVDRTLPQRRTITRQIRRSVGQDSVRRKQTWSNLLHVQVGYMLSSLPFISSFLNGIQCPYSYKTSSTLGSIIRESSVPRLAVGIFRSVPSVRLCTGDACNPACCYSTRR